MNIPKESEEQKAFVKWCMLSGFKDVVHVPNEQLLMGKINNPREKGRIFHHLMDMGVSTGFPDLIFLQRRWAIEMKSKGNTKRPLPQVEWITRLKSWGWEAGFARGCDAAIEMVTKWKNKEVQMVHAHD